MSTLATMLQIRSHRIASHAFRVQGCFIMAIRCSMHSATLPHRPRNKLRFMEIYFLKFASPDFVTAFCIFFFSSNLHKLRCPAKLHIENSTRCTFGACAYSLTQAHQLLIKFFYALRHAIHMHAAMIIRSSRLANGIFVFLCDKMHWRQNGWNRCDLNTIMLMPDICHSPVCWTNTSLIWPIVLFQRCKYKQQILYEIDNNNYSVNAILCKRYEFLNNSKFKNGQAKFSPLAIADRSFYHETHSLSISSALLMHLTFFEISVFRSALEGA